MTEELTQEQKTIEAQAAEIAVLTEDRARYRERNALFGVKVGANEKQAKIKARQICVAEIKIIKTAHAKEIKELVKEMQTEINGLNQSAEIDSQTIVQQEKIIVGLRSAQEKE